MKALLAIIEANHPRFTAEIKGCSTGEIHAFEEICPVPMPTTYKSFLEHMGKDQGRIKVYCRPPGERTGDESRYRVSIDYDTVYNDHKEQIKRFKNQHKNATRVTPDVLTGDLGEFKEDPSFFFYFGLNHLGNDNGNLFLDIRTPRLRVVEIDWYTRGVVPIAPSFVEYLFSVHFRREVSTYLHNQARMDEASKAGS